MNREKFLLSGEPNENEADEARKEADEQYPSPSGYLTRLPLYETTASSRQFFTDRELRNPNLRKHLTHVHYLQVEAMRAAGVPQDGTILSLATGDGADTLLWAEEYAHTGRVIGVNLHPIFAFGEHIIKEKYEDVDLDNLHLPMREIDAARLRSGDISLLGSPQVELITGDVTNLDRIPDSTVDGVTLNNFGHHASPETLMAALLEISRVLKPGGILGFSGRDILNMYKHWSYVPLLAKELKADEFPETFYRRCTAEQAEALLSAVFTPLPEHDYTQVEQMVIPAKDKRIFIDPFFELIPHIKHPPEASGYANASPGRVNPTRGEMLDALKNVVFPEMEAEFKRTAHLTDDDQGVITDGASQYFRIVKNNNFKKS